MSRLGHTVIGPQAELAPAHLILVVTADDAATIAQAKAVCCRADDLPNVFALIPARCQYLLADALHLLINGYRGVYWYEKDEIGKSYLLKETFKRCEARRSVKAAMGSKRHDPVLHLARSSTGGGAAAPQMMFVLWAIRHGRYTSLAEFEHRFGTGLPADALISSLGRLGVIQRQETRLPSHQTARS